ncbi:MAG: HAD family hydrolase [Oscillospiraceae bacterium]|nr:HAD family hydrolase [Oscillospiraceae bacterium]
MADISWLFFDVGSTLVDETKPYEYRLRVTAEQAGVPYETVYRKAEEFYRQNLKGDLEVMKLYGVPRPEWRSELEEPYPDTVACLEALSRKYRIGVIANQVPGTAKRLEGHGLLRFIDLVVASAEEGVAKPDKRIFDIALERAGCTPDRAVMIGDRMDNDIIPAKKIGMKTVWIRQGFSRFWHIDVDDTRADYEIDSLTELIDIFLKGAYA